MSARDEQFASIISRAGINARRVKVLGSYVHVDTFKKYEDKLSELMTSAGFSPISATDGQHLDDYNGFRMVFILR